MSKLPIIISMPHGCTKIPPEISSICKLTQADIIKDGDEQTYEIYSKIAENSQVVIEAKAARAIIDMNRAEDDIRKDGIIKTHTCWDIPIYSEQPNKQQIINLIEKYHRPYHFALTQAAKQKVRVGIDCHTMAEFGPPVGPDTGEKRPTICLGNRNGETCPTEWLEQLAKMFKNYFDEVEINRPFAGGYIVASHCHEIPWIQLEFSRTNDIDYQDKSSAIYQILTNWIKQIL